MPIRTALLTLLLAAVLLFHPDSARAQSQHISYTFKSGDTLIELANRYFRKPEQYRFVQRENRIANPRLIPVGKTIQIARKYLKYKPSQARIISVRGRVLRSGQQARNGQRLGEGNTLSTAKSSYVSLALEDGSTISLPSNSAMRIRRLRRYVLGGSLDYDFAVSRGGVRSKVRPKKSRDDRYRIRSPKAVSAVRGTDFQMRYDESKDIDFAEVVEGALAVTVGDAAEDALPAGNGLAVSASGDVTREALLPAPKLTDPGKTQSGEMLRFQAEPSGGETGYRFTIAADAGFVEIIDDVVSSTPQVTRPGIDNGNYFIKAKAISKTGIQGLPVTFAFKRRLNGVKAEAGESDDGFVFKWTTFGDGVKTFHFQLFRDSKDTVPVIEEVGLQKNNIAISDLPPGDYFWRVAVTQYLDGEVNTSWADFEKLTISP